MHISCARAARVPQGAFAIPTMANLRRPRACPPWEVLQHAGLTDVVCVVTRYFGGVLLGTGGLVRAYTTATARALENAEVVTVRSVIELSVTVDYSLYERASLLIQGAGAKLAEPEFTDRVALRWQMPEAPRAAAGAAAGIDPGQPLR